MKRILLSIILLTFCYPLVADDSTQSMHDAFAKGFQAVKSKNKDEAIQWFQKAGQFAIQSKNWTGCLDAGNALLKLGSPSESSNFFNASFNIAQEQKDWKIAIATGYAFASLPPNLNKKQDAVNAFLLAAELSKQENDWIGLSESANGLIHLQDPDHAKQVLTDAKKIVDSTKSIKGAQAVSELYNRLGLTSESSEMKNNRAEYVELHNRARKKNVPPPPPGWSPVGESVAGPPVPSIEQQKMARASADRDIDAKNQWILQQEQLELEREKLANQYVGYYYFPYGYDGYSGYQPWGWDSLVPWADYYSGYYGYSDGYYRYNGSYTGFGFGFGYADGNSAFGFSMHVSDY